MATYYDIFGQKVQYLSSDPANLTEGQVWYNSTSNTAKFESFVATGSWASGTSISPGLAAAGGAGTTTAFVIFGGSVPPHTNSSKLYDGTTWTSTGNLGTARGGFDNGVGTQTAAQATGGVTPGTFYGNNEQFNGTTWSEQNDLNTARGSMAQSGQGSQTSAIVAGGTAPPAPAPPGSTTVETWDGTSWAAGTALPTANKSMAGAGVLNSFLTFGGAPYPSVGNTTNLWNGSTWTSQPTLNTARQGLSGSGSSTLALAFAGEGSGGYRSDTESFNGSTWTTEASLSSARQQAAEGNSATAAICASGEGNTTSVEEWTGAGPVTKTITTS